MPSPPSITVALTPRQCLLVRKCLNEASGGSAEAFAAICNQPGTEFDRVRSQIGPIPNEEPISVPAGDWRIIFDAVHAAMYALGPFEVPVILGSTLVELADINLKISVDLWGAYGGLTWAERH